MNIDEQIAILQAYKEGKTITCMVKDTGSFFEVNIKKNGAGDIFDFVEYEFSINPEPREFWIVDVPVRSRLIFNRESAAIETHKAYQELGWSPELIHVREVTGE